MPVVQPSHGRILVNVSMPKQSILCETKEFHYDIFIGNADSFVVIVDSRNRGNQFLRKTPLSKWNRQDANN